VQLRVSCTFPEKYIIFPGISTVPNFLQIRFFRIGIESVQESVQEIWNYTQMIFSSDTYTKKKTKKKQQLQLTLRVDSRKIQ